MTTSIIEGMIAFERKLREVIDNKFDSCLNGLAVL